MRGGKLRVPLQMRDEGRGNGKEGKNGEGVRGRGEACSGLGRGVLDVRGSFRKMK